MLIYHNGWSCFRDTKYILQLFLQNREMLCVKSVTILRLKIGWVPCYSFYVTSWWCHQALIILFHSCSDDTHPFLAFLFWHKDVLWQCILDIISGITYKSWQLNCDKTYRFQGFKKRKNCSQNRFLYDIPLANRQGVIVDKSPNRIICLFEQHRETNVHFYIQAGSITVMQSSVVNFS